MPTVKMSLRVPARSSPIFPDLAFLSTICCLLSAAFSPSAILNLQFEMPSTSARRWSLTTGPCSYGRTRRGEETSIEKKGR
jgi:hypothetical protein